MEFYAISQKRTRDTNIINYRHKEEDKKNILMYKLQGKYYHKYEILESFITKIIKNGYNSDIQHFFAHL